MSGASCALELGAQLTARDADQRVAVGVHLLHRGGEDDAHAGGTSQLGVGLKGARVRLVVLAGAELQRVHKHRGGNNVVLLGSAAQQGGVAIVEGTHSGHVTQGGGTVLNVSAVLLRLEAGSTVQGVLRGGQSLRDSGAELRNGGHDAGHRSLSHDENSLFSGAESSVSPVYSTFAEGSTRLSIRSSCSSFNKPLLCALFAVACARAA